MNVILDFLAAAICGALSGFGVGGGTLLMVYMTAAASLPQAAAQGINLLYFLPASAAALVFHFKNKLVEGRAALVSGLAGTVTAGAAAFAATAISPENLRKLFGAFLIFTGVSILLKRPKGPK